VKVIDSVYQNPASLLVDTDVASNANIAQSKINGLTDVASKANTTYTTVNAASADWQSSYTTVQANSANWQTTYVASSAYVSSDITGLTGATQLTNMVQITLAGYNLIGTPNTNTLYIIVG
jgi:hypothetical protein